jgi:hypothetical protein
MFLFSVCPELPLMPFGAFEKGLRPSRREKDFELRRSRF